MEDSGIDSGDHNGDSIIKSEQNNERLLAVTHFMRFVNL